MTIIQIIPAFVLGGAETMCENLCYGLKELGHKVIVISLFSIHSPITERLEKHGIPIIYLNKKEGFDFSLYKKLLHVFLKYHPDVVHMHLKCVLFVMPIAIVTGVKRRVYTVHNIASKDGGRIGRYVNAFFAKYFKMIPVALTKEIRKSICSIYHIESKKVPIVMNGIDLSKCRIKTDYSFSNVVRIINIGRLEEAKNQALLIDAFYHVTQKNAQQPLKLTIIGSGSQKNQLVNLAKQLGIEQAIEFLENRESCFDDLFNSDVFVLPSKWEGMPMTIIEAMGTGLPIIASNVGGIPDMVSNNIDAILIDPNRDELVNAISKLLGSISLRERIGLQAYSNSHLYSYQHMAKEYLKVYMGNKQ